MPDQYQALAPKWAIKLNEIFTYFSKDKREDEAYGVMHSGRLALQYETGCSCYAAIAFFQDVKPEDITESDSFLVQRLETVTQWADL